jgi:hypothetical protein
MVRLHISSIFLFVTKMLPSLSINDTFLPEMKTSEKYASEQ